MWTCPKCKREFRNTNQNHSCTLISSDEVFAKRPAILKELYEKIIAALDKIGEYREEAVLPGLILFKTKSSFLGLKVKMDHLEVEFFLDHHEEHPSIANWLQTSKHRFAHVVKVDREEDITTELTEWIKRSYHLVLS